MALGRYGVPYTVILFQKITKCGKKYKIYEKNKRIIFLLHNKEQRGKL
jgi:hypothetical protein